MKLNLLLSVLLLCVLTVKCSNFEDSLELQILKELTQEGKKCIKTSGEVIFILDGSTSVGPDNFNKEKDFATQIVDKLVIGNNLTRVALITYNNNPLLVFNIDKYNNSKDVNKEILKAEFTEGITVVGDALNMVLTDIEPKTRKSTGKVIILISDGKRNGGMDPILVAKQLKSMKYLLITIGLDKETDENAMIAISDKKNFYLIKNFDALQEIAKTIVEKTCTEFHISKCSKPVVKEGPCIGREQVNIVTTFYYVNGKCISENRKLAIKCMGTGCPDPYYQKMSCGSGNSSFILFHNFTKNGKLCASTTVNLKKFTCGCPKSEESILKVIYGKECENGFRKQMLLYYEFSQFKCTETYLNLSPVKCSVLCNGTTLVTTPCKNGKRNNTVYSKVFKNNTCSLQIVKTTESHCETPCPKSILIESKECVNNSKDVFHITFENINGKCIKKTTKIKSNNCTKNQECPQPKFVRSECSDGKQAIMRISYRLDQSKCIEVNERVGMENCTIEKCPKSHYKIENCEKNSKTTSLVKTFYRKQNGKCVKIGRKIKQISCRCHINNDRNISVIVGKQCIRGYVSRYLELTEERKDKCVKVSFKLRRIKCEGTCSRRSKFIVGKCKSNTRLLQLVRAVKKDNKCVWETIRKKSVKCVELCPKPKERITRCMRGKKIVQRITFREADDECKFNITKVRVVSCKGCLMKPIYTVGKCEKNQKNTSLIRISFQQTNATCIKKQIKIVDLACQCYGATDTNVTVTFGRECINGFLSRAVELNVLKNDKCSKAAFKLRSVRCRKPCDRRTKIVVGKCKSNKRSVTILRAVRENNECKWKTVTSKFVKCKNICPTPKEKRSRCIFKKQAIFRVTFKEVGETCQFNLIRLNIVPCQGCQNSTYRVEKCEKNAKETSLIRTFFNEINGTCIKKEITVKKLSCRCTGNTTRNIEVVVGKKCESGYISRILELTEDRNDTCVKVSFKLRRIRCQRPCSRQLKLVVNKCVSNKRLIQRMKSAKEGNKCVWKVLNSKTVNCKNLCPLPKEKKLRCFRGKQAVMKLTFRNVGNVCLFDVIRVGVTNCQGCLKKPIYTVGKCEKNQKNTSLIRISFQQTNATCIKKQIKIVDLACQCYGATDTNVTVTFGRECINGFLSRAVELNVLKNDKCSKAAFKLRSVRCRKPCDRRTKIVVGKCKSNKRSVTILRAVRENNECKWKTVTSKFVKCKNICPTPKEKRSRCIFKKQAIFRVTFKEVGETCQFNLIRLNIVPCQGCQNSTYRVEKCEKNAKETSLIRTFFNEINGTCIKKEITVKKLSCRCTGNTTRNIEVVVGKKCESGYISRILELTEERNDTCVKVSFKLRRIRCQRPCSRQLKLVVNKCVSNKRLIQRMKSVKEGNKCVWKVLNSKTVNCKEICPLPSERRSRCYKGMQSVSKVTFKLIGNVCVPQIFNLNISKCQKCPKNVYRIEKCVKNSNQTFLSRTFFQWINGNCLRKESNLKALSCKCYDNITRNVSVIIDKECRNGYKSRVLELSIEKNLKCVKELFKLRSIRCENICNKTETKTDSCLLNKRFIKLYKQVHQNGRCDWVLVSSKLENCTNECPKPKITTTPCINGQRYLVRTTHQLVGNKCVSSEQKVKLLKCQKCFRKSVYELKECSRNSKTSELLRISNRNCTKKVEKLADVDCLCESLNNFGINVTSVASCINGFRSKTVSFFTAVNGKCVLQNLSVKGGKCGCFGSSYSMSLCVNGNRTLEKHTKYQSGSQCLSKLILSRKLRCKSVCPINSIVLSRKCFNNRKLRVFDVFEQSGNQCKLVKFNFKWLECSTKPISDLICSKNHTLTMSNCHNGSAFIIYTKFAAKTVNGKCIGNSSKIAEIACSGRCERTIRPKLVSGKCVKNIKRLFFIASRPQGNQCLHKIDYLGKIDCKNC